MSITKQHSRYWIDEDLFEKDDGGSPQTDLQRITRLAAVRRGIANFVSILSGENIPVHFSSGKTSYTDGQQVVISADEDPEKFDAMVGLALHEGSHVLLSDFSFLHALKKNIEDNYRQFYLSYWWASSPTVLRSHGPDVFHAILHPDISKLLPDMNCPTGGMPEPVNPYWDASLRVLEDLRFLMNILEDRRIDSYVYKNAMGYRPYYQALYDKYFFTAEVGRNLRFNPEWRELTVENYINRLLYAFHPAADLDAMPGLRSLVARMDLNNIDRVSPEHDAQIPGVGKAWRVEPTYGSMPNLWKEANVLYAHILKYTGMAEYKEQSSDDDSDSTGGASKHPMMDGLKNDPSALDGLPNLDDAPSPQEMEPTPVEKDTKGAGKNKKEIDGKYNAKKAQKELADAKKMMSGETKKKKLSKQDSDAVSALEAADASMVDITGDGIPYGRCMVTRKMTDQLIEQDWFIFKRWDWKNPRNNDYVENSISAGKRMGQILVHRLQVRNDPLITKQTRLPQGGLDRRLLAQLGMDITSVFQKSRTDIHKPAMLHLTLDASGSMSGKKWNKVRTVAVALAYVGSKLRNVDTVISIRGGNDMPIVSVVYDSRKDQFPRFVRYMRLLEPSGGTPEGLCFKATMDLIQECKATHDVYFINFSDGEPGFAYSSGKKGRYRYAGDYVNYAGDLATTHTRKMVQQIKDAGIKVLSYYISESAYSNQYTLSVFRKMYGEDATTVNVENATEVLRTLNSRLLVRG